MTSEEKNEEAVAPNLGMSPNPYESEEEEVDLLFRAEIKIRDFVLGYWKHSLYALGVVLLISLAYGLYRSSVIDGVRASSAAMAEVDRDLPQTDQALLLGVTPPSAEDLQKRQSEQSEVAARYESVASDATGPMKGGAWLKAAEAWWQAGDSDAARRAYEQILGHESRGMLAYAAHLGLATLDEEGEAWAEAQAHYREVADQDRGAYAETALTNMIRLSELSGDAAAGSTAREELQLRFPNSPAVQSALQDVQLADPEAGSDGG